MNKSVTTIQFDDAGYLPDATHQFTLADFIRSFCAPATVLAHSESASSNRGSFVEPLTALYKWADEQGATSLIVGGSFITTKANPRDLDVLVLFPTKSDIASPSPWVAKTAALIDVQCLPEDEPELLQAFLQLIGADRRNIGRGLAQIKFHSGVKTHFKADEPSAMLPVATLLYLHRFKSLRASSERLVIPIHGIRSDAQWLSKFTFLASTSGWAVAPFMYGFESGTILGDEGNKARVVNEFRMFLDEIRKTYKGSISIVAHSFGSYIVAKYLRTAGDLVERFGGIVLTGSILNTEFDWSRLLADETVNMVMNTRSTEDEWVKMLPDGGIKYFAQDPLLGRSAVDGFKIRHPRLTERQSNLLSHSNMFESDVVLKLWLPFLELAEKLVPIVDGNSELP